jgi:acyl carrier protein phosphodiesterase
MNLLAHCFLSLDDEDVLIGNFIGDFVKGHAWKNYPIGVQKGILLHRAIDSFTDHHTITDVSVRRIRPFAGRYAPPFVDILYDHLLAVHWKQYTAESFDDFAARTYAILESRVADMPEVLRARMPRMLEGKFLHGYTHREGLEWVLGKFSLRLAGNFDSSGLSRCFFEEIDAFSADFNAFFPDLLAMVNTHR